MSSVTICRNYFVNILTTLASKDESYKYYVLPVPTAWKQRASEHFCNYDMVVSFPQHIELIRDLARPGVHHRRRHSDRGTRDRGGRARGSRRQHLDKETYPSET